LFKFEAQSKNGCAFFMSNKERAEAAHNIVGDIPMLSLKFAQLNNAYYAIYGEYLKRSCLNSIRNAYQKIHEFIKAHK
jgi:hypothetical protein